MFPVAPVVAKLAASAKINRFGLAWIQKNFRSEPIVCWYLFDKCIALICMYIAPSSAFSNLNAKTQLIESTK